MAIVHMANTIKGAWHASAQKNRQNSKQLMVVHDGEACPVDAFDWVRVLHRNGQITSDVAIEYVWPHQTDENDVIAYCVVASPGTLH